MKLKTTSKIAIERGIQTTNNDIELIGCDSFCECDKILNDFVTQNNICSKGNSFLKLFGTKSKFYYLAEIHNLGEVKSFEVGLAYLEIVNKKTILKRFKPLYYSLNKLDPVPCIGPPTYFYLNKNDVLVISSYTPRTYIELLPDPNCIISSIESFCPTTVYVNKNSVVGRLNSNVESISIPSLLNQIIKYEDGKVKFFNGSRWTNLVEEKDEDTK